MIFASEEKVCTFVTLWMLELIVSLRCLHASNTRIRAAMYACKRAYSNRIAATEGDHGDVSRPVSWPSPIHEDDVLYRQQASTQTLFSSSDPTSHTPCLQHQEDRMQSPRARQIVNKRKHQSPFLRRHCYPRGDLFHPLALEYMYISHLSPFNPT